MQLRVFFDHCEESGEEFSERSHFLFPTLTLPWGTSSPCFHLGSGRHPSAAKIYSESLYRKGVLLLLASLPLPFHRLQFESLLGPFLEDSWTKWNSLNFCLTESIYYHLPSHRHNWPDRLNRYTPTTMVTEKKVHPLAIFQKQNPRPRR